MAASSRATAVALRRRDAAALGASTHAFEVATRAILLGDVSQVHAWCEAALEILDGVTSPREAAYRGGELIAAVMREARECDSDPEEAAPSRLPWLGVGFALGLAAACAVHLWWLAACVLLLTTLERRSLARVQRYAVAPLVLACWCASEEGVPAGLVRLHASVSAWAAFPRLYWLVFAIALLRSLVASADLRDDVQAVCAAFALVAL